MISSAICVFSLGFQKRSESEPVAAPENVAETAPSVRLDATDEELAALGREYAAKFDANPWQTFVDFLDVDKVLEIVAKNDVVPVDESALAEIIAVLRSIPTTPNRLATNGSASGGWN